MKRVKREKNDDTAAVYLGEGVPRMQVKTASMDISFGFVGVVLQRPDTVFETKAGPPTAGLELTSYCLSSCRAEQREFSRGKLCLRPAGTAPYLATAELTLTFFSV